MRTLSKGCIPAEVHSRLFRMARFDNSLSYSYDCNVSRVIQALNEVHSLRTWVNGGEHSAQKLGQGLHTQMRHHELKVIQQEETICKLQRELDKQARQHAEEMAFHHKRCQKWLDDKHQQIQGILSELAAEKVKSSS